MAVTQAAGNNTTALATTAFVQSAVAASTIADATDTVKGKLRLRGDLGGTADVPTVPDLALKAPLQSPSLTGTPLAPTAAAGTNTTQIATTAFVTTAIVGKQDTITLTTTGTGAASLVGSTLNIPTPNNGTVTEVSALTIGTSGTDITSTVATATTTPVVTLNVPTASAANRGALSATDWTTFNDKIGGSGTTNFIPKFSAAKTLTDSSIFDDGTSVGIGTSSPANTLEINQGTAGNSGLRFTNLNSSSVATTASNKVLGVNSTGDVILTNVPGTQNIVTFSTATPTTSGVVFTPNTPTDQSVVYQSEIDNSLWTYNGTTYVTYIAPASTAWNLAGTSNDAGSNKTSSIWRSGGLGIGINNPTSLFEVYSSGSNLATISTIGTGTTNAGINFITLKDNSSIGASTNRGWQIAARSNAWNSGGTNEANALTMSYWNGSVWQQALKAGVNGNIALGSVVYNSMPQYNLDVYGTLRSTNSSYLATNSGNVGIGTLTPVGSLMLYGNSQALSGYSKEIVFGRGGATKGLAAIAATDSGNFGGGLAFITKPSNSIDDFPVNVLQAMTIDPSGKVGIGSTSPLGRLIIDDKSYIGNVPVSTANLMDNSTFRPLTRFQNTVGINNNALSIYSTTSAFAMQSHNYSTGATLPYVLQPAGGNVGIGTSSPSAQLHTTGSVRFAGAGTPAAGKVLTSDASGNATWQNTPGATINIQTGNYTLTENDSKGVVIINSNSNVTVTVPVTLSAGFFCQIIQKGLGQVTVVGDVAASVVINSANGASTRAQFSSIGLLMESSTTGYISGDSGL